MARTRTLRGYRVPARRSELRVGPAVAPYRAAVASRVSPASIWRAVIGPPLATERQQHERLNSPQALAILGSDALSSAAYGPEEVLRVLAPAGAAALALSPSIGVAIAVLVIIVATSYYQTIHAYPTGGGAYIVARENLGVRAGLAAAAALLVDYALTVAVSISAGVSNIASAFPQLHPWRMELATTLIVFITITNLRGVRESGRLFAVPTYSFVAALACTLVGGAVMAARGTLPHVATNPPAEMRALTAFLVLRAFASGTAALTGIEAVANGVKAFREPEVRNASRVLLIMAAILATFVIGVLLLAHQMGVLPSDQETVVSQVARGVFGNSPFYYWVQISTLTILVMAANTAFADFPRLAAILARDEYMPHQFANLGDRLVYANGIAVLGLIAMVLVVVFGATVHHLIPLYTVGVFVAFTLSQFGMVRHWARVRGNWWRTKLGINAVGGAITGIVGLEVGLVKFADGAWVALLVMVIVMAGMRYVRGHYELVRRLLAVDRARPVRRITRHRVIIPIGDVHRGVIEAVRYAQAISDDVTAVYVAVDPEASDDICARWERNVPGVPLVILPSPYRSVVRPILDYLDRLQAESEPEALITVVLPEFVTRRWWDGFLHNQTALMLRLALLYSRRRGRRRRVVADVPYYLAR